MQDPQLGFGMRPKFRVVSSEISKVATPGDGGTNEMYSSMMYEIETVLTGHGALKESVGEWLVDATRQATDQELLLAGVHTQSFIEAMRQRTMRALLEQEAKGHQVLFEAPGCSAGWGIDTETAARTGVASLIDCAKDVLGGKCGNGFVLARPPSHHAIGNAERARNGAPADLPYGFCHLNSIASAIESLRADTPRLRVCVFDFDVHPGNGNEDTFWNDPSVLTISIHQDKIWPGPNCGRADHIGGPDALGSVLNVPMPRGSGDTEYARAVLNCAFPKIHDFKPDIIFVAAGFDALGGDAYGSMELTENWYGWCIAELMSRDVAPLVLNLEGGYHPANVARAVGTVVDALAGASVAEFLERRLKAEGSPIELGGNGTSTPMWTRALENAAIEKRRAQIAIEAVMGIGATFQATLNFNTNSKGNRLIEKGWIGVIEELDDDGDVWLSFHDQDRWQCRWQCVFGGNFHDVLAPIHSEEVICPEQNRKAETGETLAMNKVELLVGLNARVARLAETNDWEPYVNWDRVPLAAGTKFRVEPEACFQCVDGCGPNGVLVTDIQPPNDMALVVIPVDDLGLDWGNIKMLAPDLDALAQAAADSKHTL